MPSAPMQRLTGACDLSRSPNEVQRRKGDFKHCSRAVLVAMHCARAAQLLSAAPRRLRTAGLPGCRAGVLPGLLTRHGGTSTIKVASFACRGPVADERVASAVSQSVISPTFGLRADCSRLARHAWPWRGRGADGVASGVLATKRLLLQRRPRHPTPPRQSYE
jgi:hypothetical protein